MSLNVAAALFKKCVLAMNDNKLISSESDTDKEFHFQNWVKDRIGELRLDFETAGRNSYPDFRMVSTSDGFEVKGLAYPGRDLTYDSNSQIPSGVHNGRTIYYIFGRYPAKPDGRHYPVMDLAICHGDFLNADHGYTHANKSVKGFGSYGDVMIRDRKMYVLPTPFAIAAGTTHHRTLILPSDAEVPGELARIGVLSRIEADRVIVGYNFDLRSSEITARTEPNPAAGKRHEFCAWRLAGDPDDPVRMRGEGEE